MAREDQPAVVAATAKVALIGRVDEEMLKSLAEQLGAVEAADAGDVTVELTTLGGDAELGRRALLDIEHARRRLAPRRLTFLGKTVVYSAGLSLMSGFPREDRFLARDAMLLIHCRQLEEDVKLSGPIRASVPLLKAKLQELETGIRLEVEAFEKLIEGSKVSMDTLLEKALYNWYVPADEAVELGLVAQIV